MKLIPDDNLLSLIRVNANYTRSINLERDHESVTLIKSYIPTSRSIYALEKALNTLDTTVDMPRAWSLVGPYGSGKSSFATFLSHLVANPNKKTTKAALDALKKEQPALHKKFEELGKDIPGHCVVLLTGSPEPLGRRLVRALADAAEEYWGLIAQEPPKEVTYLEVLNKQEVITTSEIIKAIKGLQKAIINAEGNGLLIVIDELGKFLEYEARHPEINDIYLLQALAELAYKGGEAALSLYVILHQSFEQYAKGLGDSLKNEWAKVQGRFENIPFLEATEQTLRIVASAIEHDKKLDNKNIRKQCLEIAKTLSKADALPGTLEQKTAADLFEKCYPIHPVSALLLPILCQKVAQNERTLFNYLGSQESFGFKNSLSNLSEVGDWIYPWEIYEYFIRNQSAALVDHITHRRWAEVVTAVERLGDIDSNETRLLKAIGLLNIIGSQGGLKASKEIVKLCSPNEPLASELTESLLAGSIIQYRKYNSEYRVWQGSDFDIESATENESQKLGWFSLAEYLNNQYEAQPIVARRFSIKTGSLRYFETVYADSESISKTATNSEKPRVIFYLSQNQDDSEEFQTNVINKFGKKDVLVEFPQSDQLRDAITEVRALNIIQQSSQELQGDPIAQREFKDRLRSATQLEEEKFSEILEHPEKSKWFWNKKNFSVHNKRDLQKRLSSILDSVYKYSPVIKNELINREKPSSQAAAARNKLLHAMVMGADKADLNIEKFPPEKAIYRAVLRETHLHKEVDGKWQFTKPDKTSTIYNAWMAMEKFLYTTEKKPRAFSELKDLLTKAPYGIKEGLLPIFYLALYLVNKDEIALYEDRRYMPTITKDMLERFVKNPQNFTIQLFKIEGFNASLFEHYTDALFPKQKPTTVIQAIKPLAQFMSGLDEYTKKTSDVSPKAQALRSAFNLSKSPEDLMFKGMPKALGYKGVDDDNLESFAVTLKSVIQELKYAHDKLLEDFEHLLSQALNIKDYRDLKQLRELLSDRYKGLDRYTVDTDGLRAFIGRLTNKDETTEKWYQGLLMFLGKKLTEKWNDVDRARAEMHLSQFARKIIDLRTLRLEEDRTKQNTSSEFEVILLKSLRKGAEQYSQAVSVTEDMQETVNILKKEIRERLSDEESELQLAVLAEMVDEFLSDYQSGKTKSPKGKASALRKVNNG